MHKKKLIVAKNYFRILFCVTICLILLSSLGFSTLNSELLISGDAYIRAKSDIRVNSLSFTSSLNGGYITYESQYTKDTTKLFTTLPNLDSSVTYTVIVKNNSSYPYSLDSINDLNSTNSNMKYVLNNISVGDIINAGVSKTFTITVSYNDSVTGLPNDITSAFEIEWKFVIADTTPPLISSRKTYIEQGEILSIFDIASVLEEESGIASISVHDSDSSIFQSTATKSDDIINEGYNTFIDTSNWSLGKHTLTFVIPDKAGNVSPVSINVMVYKEILCDNSITFNGNSDGLYRDTNESGHCIYRGASPNNYIKFNVTYASDGTPDTSTGEMYRIVSVDGAGKLKLLSNESITTKSNYSWSSTATTTAKYYLNNTYLSTLNSIAVNQISPTKFYYGYAFRYTASTAGTLINDIEFEKNVVDTEEVSIGVISVTDYLRASTDSSCINFYSAYSGTSCYNNNWMVLRDSSNSLVRHGFINYYYNSSSSTDRRWVGGYSTSYAIRPISATTAVRASFYLKEGLVFIDGDGTESNPYILMSTTVPTQPDNVVNPNGAEINQVVSYILKGNNIAFDRIAQIKSPSNSTISSIVVKENGTILTGTSNLSLGEHVLNYTVTASNGTVVRKDLTIIVYKILECSSDVTESGNSDGLYRDSIDATRCVFKGSTPNNYIMFNSSYSSSSIIPTGDGEVYRIVSVESGNSLKIVSHHKVADSAWNSSTTSSWHGSTIWTYLNETYYNSLNSYTQKLIEPTKFYVGTMGYNYSGDTSKAKTIADTVTAEKTTVDTETSNIGLLNVYDFLLASGNISSSNPCISTTTWSEIGNQATVDGTKQHRCEAYNWMVPTSTEELRYDDLWFITLGSESGLGRYWDESVSSSIWRSDLTGSKAVVPTLYLSRNAIIVGGTGTENDPYLLGRETYDEPTAPTLEQVLTTIYHKNDVAFDEIVAITPNGSPVDTIVVKEGTTTLASVSDLSIGSHTLSYIVTDYWGNVATGEYTLNVVEPSAPTISAGQTVIPYNDDVPFTSIANITVGESPISNIIVKENNQQISTTMGLSIGEHTLHFIVTDEYYDKTGSSNHKVELDIVVMVVKMSVSCKVEGSTTYTENLKLTINYNRNGNTLAAEPFSWDNGNTWTTKDEKTVTAAGLYEASVKDTNDQKSVCTSANVVSQTEYRYSTRKLVYNSWNVTSSTVEASCSAYTRNYEKVVCSSALDITFCNAHLGSETACYVKTTYNRTSYYTSYSSYGEWKTESETCPSSTCQVQTRTTYAVQS